jgi:hypothetical protein
MDLYGRDFPNSATRLWNGHVRYDDLAYELYCIQDCTYRNPEHWLENMDGNSLLLSAKVMVS